MSWHFQLKYSLNEVYHFTRQELIVESEALNNNYQIYNEKAFANIIGTPKLMNIHGEKRYCLHYASKNRKNGPVFFDIHGGGFIWGAPEEDDLFSSRLNKTLDIEVYSLEYPRTAAHPYPEALNQLYDTIKYMSEHAEYYNFDMNQIIIGGHSAGGNLAAALTLLCKERRELQIRCQVLAYPVVAQEYAFTDEDFKNDDNNVSPEMLEFMKRVYESPNNVINKFCAPILASEEELRGLPPAVIMLCQKDIFRTQGREYASRLVAANVPVLIHEFENCPHAFEIYKGKYMQEGQDFLINGIRHFVGMS
jgi:acetyl esterase